MGHPSNVINFKKRQIIISYLSTNEDLQSLFKTLIDLEWDIADAKIIPFSVDHIEENEENLGDMKKNYYYVREAVERLNLGDEYDKEQLYLFERFLL